ncbi:MAG: ribonuclease J [Eubacteriales bacterium]|jgi:ribonuclease J|nr:ribonuclease J [Clostridiales bacterium]
MARSKKITAFDKLKVIALGGLDEIGKNLYVLEYDSDIIVVDCGLGFPDEDMPGVDFVIPDITYLVKNSDKVRGIFITHGHEDHIGALPYVLRSLHVPVYGTRLTLGIIENKLDEHKLDFKPELICVKAGDKIKAGVFTVEYIRVNHSIADACSLAIKTPLGSVVHTGDFKFDLSPIDGEVMDVKRLAELGGEGVLLLMCDSTNADRPGYTPSERTVGATFDQIFISNPKKRVIVATFSSNVHRVQQIIDYSIRHGRKVAITGRSMINIVGAAVRLGYMNFPENAIIDISEIKRYPDNRLTIITTGSQGEPMSALSRMAFGDHSCVSVGPNDLVIISANAIPGNEKLVGKIINELYRCGAEVYNDTTTQIHVSGHACQEDLKLMHALTKPKYFMPIHGERRHLMEHRKLALFMGIKPENIFVPETGRVLEIDQNGARFNGTVTAGRVLVDGSGVGDVGSIVLRDRILLSQDGLIIVSAAVDMNSRLLLTTPEIFTRGFVYVKESEELMDEMRLFALEALENALYASKADLSQIKSNIKDSLSKFINLKTKRHPMIMPIIISV